MQDVESSRGELNGSSKLKYSFADPLVENTFAGWKPDAQRLGQKLRALIFERAAGLQGVGRIEETLKWNQPAYLTPETGAGSTIRMSEITGQNQFGLYFHCQTSLVETFRTHYTGQLEFQKNRAIILDTRNEPAMDILSHCIDLALTYHLNKKH